MMRKGIPDWLFTAAQRYNLTSLENRDAYAGLVAIPLNSLSEILEWTFRSLPDEILVGIDMDNEKVDCSEGLSRYIGSSNEPGLFAGQGMLVGRPHLVNRGDSYRVHHVPESGWMVYSLKIGGLAEGGLPTGCILIRMLQQFRAGPVRLPNSQGVDMILGGLVFS